MDEEQLEQLAGALRRYRKGQDLSQYQLAELSLVSRTWISYLESANPRATSVSERTLKLLERALKLDPDTLCQFLSTSSTQELAASNYPAPVDPEALLPYISQQSAIQAVQELLEEQSLSEQARQKVDTSIVAYVQLLRHIIFEEGSE